MVTMRNMRKKSSSRQTRRTMAANRFHLPHARRVLRHYWRNSRHPQLAFARRRKSTCPLFPLALS
eukprot:4685871-Heterocapsa_arctica.AAC.1